VVTLAIWREVTPGAILTKCGMWADMVDVITCAIFGECRLRGVGLVRGVILPFPIDLMYRPYNDGHTYDAGKLPQSNEFASVRCKVRPVIH